MWSASTDLFTLYITTVTARVKKHIDLSLSKNTFRQRGMTQTHLYKSEFVKIQILLWNEKKAIYICFAGTSHYSSVLSVQAFPSTSAAPVWAPCSQLNYWMSTYSVTTLGRCWWKIASACIFFSTHSTVETGWEQNNYLTQQKCCCSAQICSEVHQGFEIKDRALSSLRTMNSGNVLWSCSA